MLARHALARRCTHTSLRVAGRRYYQRRIPTPSSPELSSLLALHASSSPTPLQPISLSALLSFGRPLTPQSVLASAKFALSEIPRRLAVRVRSLETLPYLVVTNPYIENTLNAYRRSFLWLADYGKEMEESSWKRWEENATESEEFAHRLEELVRAHANDVPTMAKGFQECTKYLSPTQISTFLDGAIRNRISVRLIAEQHISLSHALKAQLQSQSQQASLFTSSQQGSTSRVNAGDVGVVSTKCSPAEMIRMCGSFVSDLCEVTLGTSPSIVVDGASEATFAYVPVHLEYILTEVLKNSFRATVEHFYRNTKPGATALPPVRITLASPPSLSIPASSATPVAPASTASTLTASSTTTSPAQPTPPTFPPQFFSIRVRDQGGGVSPSNMARIFSYAFTTASSSSSGDDGMEGGPYAAQQVGGSAAIGADSYDRGGGVMGLGGDTGGAERGGGQGNLFGEITGKGLQTGMGTIAGLGYGLPMSRLYARYFGGSLDLVSLEGWGSDVFIKLRCLNEAEDSTI